MKLKVALCNICIFCWLLLLYKPFGVSMNNVSKIPSHIKTNKLRYFIVLHLTTVVRSINYRMPRILLEYCFCVATTRTNYFNSYVAESRYNIPFKFWMDESESRISQVLRCMKLRITGRDQMGEESPSNNKPWHFYLMHTCKFHFIP
jgi:hypothetical protein